MLGIVFTGGQGPLLDLLLEYLGAYPEEKYVVAADSGAMLAMDSGFLPDLLVGDMDSIAPSLLTLLQEKGVQVIKHDKDKDESDTDLALQLLVEKGCETRILVGGGGGRMDHFLAIVRSMQKDAAPNLWITGNDVFYKVNKSATFKIEPGKEVSFFPIGLVDGYRVETEGLDWELNDFKMDNSFFSLSNRSSRGEFSLRIIDEGLMLVVTEIESELVKI